MNQTYVRPRTGARVVERRLCGYSESDRAIETIRILHHHAPGDGWSLESPDIPGLTGGSDAYDAAKAEQAARFALACAAEEQAFPHPRSPLRALRAGGRRYRGVVAWAG